MYISESPQIIIVDSHHKVLQAWADYRSQLNKSPRLFTLDHHTDTSKPFRNFIKNLYGNAFANEEQIRNQLIEDIDFLDSVSVHTAIQKLSNDEHIVTAIRSDIISSALVVAQNAMNTNLATYQEHKIVCRSVGGNSNLKTLERFDYDKVIESDFLNEVIQSFNVFFQAINEPILFDGPYVLDIDLDYFNTLNSIRPKDVSKLKELARGAGLITIATEPDYVKKCAVDKSLTSEFLLDELNKILTSI